MTQKQNGVSHSERIHVLAGGKIQEGWKMRPRLLSQAYVNRAGQVQKPETRRRQDDRKHDEELRCMRSAFHGGVSLLWNRWTQKTSHSRDALEKYSAKHAETKRQRTEKGVAARGF